MRLAINATDALAARLTRAASKQTYYTIRFLVDRDRVPDAYRAYAYFRWVDDRLDEGGMGALERLAFVERQTAILNRCYRNRPLGDLALEEQMLAELIRRDVDIHSGLKIYLHSMMSVMAFDAERRGRLISQSALAEYSRWLAAAVTEAMHYFIGHSCPPPQSEARYLAVTAAHITHMLRDTCEDVAAGYYNIPREYLDSHQITPQDVASDSYRAWVKSRVQLARTYFKAGRGYLAQVETPRCRLAGLMYIARFEGVLDAIEREGYRLRADYPGGASLGGLSRMTAVIVGSVLSRRLSWNTTPDSAIRRYPQREP